MVDRQGGQRAGEAGGRGLLSRLRSRSPLALAALGALLLVAAATAASEEWAFLESEGGGRVLVPDAPIPLAYVAAAAGVVLLVCMLALRLGEDRNRPERRRRRGMKPLAIALALVFLWAMLPPLQRIVQTALRAAGVEEEGTPHPGQTPQLEQSEGKSNVERSRPLGWAVLIAFILAIAAVIAAMVMLLRQQPPPPRPRRRRAPPSLLSEIEASEADLRTIGDPRAAIIACYSRMQKVVYGAGVSRRESDTPYELLDRLLLDQRISQESARALTELFETAKFSIRPIDESMRTRALEALGGIRSSLEEQAA